LKNLLGQVNIFFANEKEAKKLSGETKVRWAVERVAALGPRLVVVKSGEHGAVAYDGKTGAYFMAPAYPDCAVVDPTGAGDSFAGGFLGSLLSEQDPYSPAAIKKALYTGNALSSFAISSFSADGLWELGRDDIDRRIRTLLAMTQLDGSSTRPSNSGKVLTA
jgi:sugar/nucleoside kinase (ribokinase family)